MTKFDEALEKFSKKVGEAVASKYMNDSLNNNARRLRKLIPLAGKPFVRSEFIKGTEQDIKDEIKQGKTKEEILAPCYEAPEYLELLKDLDMNMTHIEVMTNNILKRADNES